VSNPNFKLLVLLVTVLGTFFLTFLALNKGSAELTALAAILAACASLVASIGTRNK
jgi:hypothetical protein